MTRRRRQGGFVYEHMQTDPFDDSQWEMHMRAVSLLVAATAVTVTITGAGSAVAQSVEEFYRGKTINMTISSGEGGTNDAYARLIAEQLGKFIPGSPMIIPRNMPGAGGLKATNYMYDKASKDGLSYGIVQRGTAVQPIMDIQSANYDPSKFNWIGSTARETSVGVVWNASTDVRTIQDAMKKEVIVGSSGVGNDTGGFPLVLNYFLGTKFKLIHGYKSGSEISLAMERGEVQARVGWSWGSVTSRSADLLRDKKITVLIQMGLEKADDLPDVPLVLDLAKTPEDRDAMELIFAATTIGWPSIMPPDVPKDRVAAVRAAYNQMVKSAEFKAQAEKRNLELDPVTGEQIDKIVARIMSFPKPVVERAQRAMNAAAAQEGK
jgi:tripartite-type tricarboxylate transporter receptor subunit TctC